RAPRLIDSVFALSPEYAKNSEMTLRERSAMNWPEQVNVPLLIVHGAKDDEVPATEALAFTSKVAQLQKRYELLIYGDDIHEVAVNHTDRDARVVQWFKRHMR